MTIWARGRFGSAMRALTLTLVTGPVMAQAQQKVLRVVPQGEVKVFDPHQSQVNLTSMHAGLVYDTLFSWDADMVARPQMVERWTVSDDRLLYTFTLRAGLKFSDGSPVTTRDAIATLKRLFLRDSQIQSLAQRVASLESIDDSTFTLGLKEPFRFVEFLLGGSNGIAGAIMREKEAMTDPYTPITEVIGSGPFRFVKSEYRPGAKLVYEKTPSTSRAPIQPAASPAANWPRSTASSLSSFRTRRSRSLRCATARSISSTRPAWMSCRRSPMTPTSWSVRCGQSRPTRCCVLTASNRPSIT
jgi:ABC-type transport system substrate-binding protein